ncbi:large ribosomal subunit protein bL19m isoform X2 [Parasteatoda tepidariorum]|uniref:large ribosomal subunit protein bL19m isoform X2 n=1 Tax=Parasteatoda tepidariorum TaxID=114398 RepID=UPI00077F9DF5|nr:39S ribosomal protein L19, mitochondrial isoform X2 [Parasteatoda tepidariorum]
MSLTVLLKSFCSRNVKQLSSVTWRYFSTDQQPSTYKKKEVKTEKIDNTLAEHRFIYPEFLPDPRYEFRNKIREKLEREDMLKRRSVINIPEFYVGSILAVTASDKYDPGKQNRFVGICIARSYVGLRATFVLRNVVDHQGVEILYDMYNPSLLSIEVLRLEKRLDDELYYLRDAPPEFSTFPFNMEPEFIVPGDPIRVNPLKVRLKPPPWCHRWEIKNMKGIENVKEHVSQKAIAHARTLEQPFEAYDLMKEYRRCIPEEDQKEIWEEVESHRKQFPVKKQAWKRTLQRAKPKRTL